MRPVASVIIPCFNYSRQIRDIVAEIQQSSYVKEIIIVDDGSNEETKNILLSVPGVVLMTHPTNRGKAAALMTGLEHCTRDIVVFIDEDLTNFSHTHLDALIRPVINGRFDATISEREHEWWLTKWTGFPSAYSGERVMKRSMLTEHLDMFHVRGFQIEPSFNKVLFRDHEVAKVFFRGVGQVAKVEKRGPIGLVADFKMFFDVLAYLGPGEMLFQLRYARNMPTLNV